jgi:DNA-binding CsgD family transcriptional regulator
MVMLGSNDVLQNGTLDGLLDAREDAYRSGAVVIGYVIDLGVAAHAMLSGDHERATEILAGCADPIERMGLTNLTQYAAVVHAGIAAQENRRADMERELRRFRQLGGDATPYTAMASGACEAVCCLLEEDRDGARDALAKAAAYEEANPSVFHNSGRYGLFLLLRAVDGTLSAAEYGLAARTTSSRLIWNRQFAGLAHAVLLGRAGQGAAAEEAVRNAGESDGRFAWARQLGRRLAAEAAIADGWGDPVAWLREAEAYFYGTGRTTVASACRALLRQTGASVAQRRGGHERIPEQLRRVGVTTREHEVMELLARRLTNKQIGARLHISPRTVEKHVASLIAKTALRDRSALSNLASAVAQHR